MGGLCSKRPFGGGNAISHNDVDTKLNISSVQLVAPSLRGDVVVEVTSSHGGNNEGSVRLVAKPSIKAYVDDDKKVMIIERPTAGHHQRRATLDLGSNRGKPAITSIVSIPRGAEGELIVAGWPSWLTSVAGEAIQGWLPRKADSFEKLDKIGQGTYSSVYKARDLETGKIVAMKKVRFVNMDPESVRFMAREIYILRKLDHPNVMKLESLVTSRMSCSLYLVFEYMDHDLAGLAATRSIKFSESQIKCYMQQLLHGLEHCHSRGVLHRDIKGSNLLIDNNGVLKIGDFGLANFFRPDQQQPLTSRVVTLWYRAPELLLGASDYGVGVDLWSTGCILAELFAGKPIMPGRTEVEQMHKIFKLCGSPSEEYWRKSKLPHATSFKPQHPYTRQVSETFREFPPSALALIDLLLAMEPEIRGSASSALNSEFFTTNPLPCDPSSLPKYPSSKEFDAKLRDEEARKRKAEAAKCRGPESVKRGLRDKAEVPSPEFNTHGPVSLQGQSTSYKYNYQEDGGSGFPLEPPRVNAPNGFSHSSSMVHPSAFGASWNKTGKGVVRKGSSSSRHGSDLRTQRSLMPRAAGESNTSHRQDEPNANKEYSTGYVVPKKNRMHYSGPLMPPGGNLDEMLKEHERQIQQAVRNARLDKTRTKLNYNNNGQSEADYHHRNGR